MAKKKNDEQQKRLLAFSTNHDALVNQNDKEGSQSLLADTDKLEEVARRAGYQVSQFDTSSRTGASDFFDSMAFSPIAEGEEKAEEKKDEKPASKNSASKAEDKKEESKSDTETAKVENKKEETALPETKSQASKPGPKPKNSTSS